MVGSFNEQAQNLWEALRDEKFIESQKAADEVKQNSLEGDVDARPGKQKGTQGKQKQDQQDSIATFPTVPHSEGPMVKARKGKCPTGTRSVGGGFCKNPKAGKLSTKWGFITATHMRFSGWWMGTM